jgi:hypothetical protein
MSTQDDAEGAALPLHDDVEAQIHQQLRVPLLDDMHDPEDPPSQIMPTPTHMTKADIAQAEQQKVEDERRARLLAISFIAMIVIGLGNKIFGVLMYVPMGNYPLFVNMLTTFVYLPVCFAYIWPMMKWGTTITPEAVAIPQYKFAIMGCLDSIAGIMQSLAVNFIANGSLFILLGQAAIPVSMVISYWLLKTKYTLSQYVGAAVVALGVIIALIPFFVDPSGDNNSHGSNVWLWSIVNILSAIPQCLSSVYKEKALGEVEIDPIYLNGWVAVYQFIASFPLLIPSAPASNIGVEQVPQNLLDGASCLAGVNTLPSDDCAMSPIFVSVYLFFNVIYNVLIILILKYGSSNVLWLSMTVMVPLGNVSFTLPFMPNRTTLQPEDIVALIVIMLGLITYRFYDKIYAAWKKRHLNLIVSVAPPSGSPVAPDSPLFGTPGDKPGEPGTPARGLHVHTTIKKKKKTVKRPMQERRAGASSRVPTSYQSVNADDTSP